jgi:catechol 2,3-dioxygenase-like lactoylglutathione lyase family enzyme
VITISRFIHVNVVCQDLEKSLEFYVDVLGANVHEIFTSADSDLRDVMGVDESGASGYRAALIYWGDSKRGPYIDLVQWVGESNIDSRPPLTAQDRGLVRVALQVDDVDAVAQELRSKGITLLGDVHEAPVGPWKLRLVLCEDPDGTLIEFVTFPGGETRATNTSKLSRSDLAELSAQSEK